jgi:hypothetical protein
VVEEILEEVLDRVRQVDDAHGAERYARTRCL